MTALLIYMCLDFEASFNFVSWRIPLTMISGCLSVDHGDVRGGLYIHINHQPDLRSVEH